MQALLKICFNTHYPLHIKVKYLKKFYPNRKSAFSNGISLQKSHFICICKESLSNTFFLKDTINKHSKYRNKHLISLMGSEPLWNLISKSEVLLANLFFEFRFQRFIVFENYLYYKYLRFGWGHHIIRCSQIFRIENCHLQEISLKYFLWNVYIFLLNFSIEYLLFYAWYILLLRKNTFSWNYVS